jgi:hypothetical protein
MMNKRGWMRILEATIAVMIVSGVLIVVYSRQVDRGTDPADYFYSLQRQILMDISSSSALRLAVLDGDINEISGFVEAKIPEAFGYFIRICDLGDTTDYCKIKDDSIIRETRDKDVFVEEIVVSSDLGVGSNSRYKPKKLRLFVWEVR